MRARKCGVVSPAGGVANFARAGAHGAQLGVANVAFGPVPVQLGVLNLAGGESRAQLGVANVVTGSVRGQLGVANVAWGNARSVRQCGWTATSVNADPVRPNSCATTRTKVDFPLPGGPAITTNGRTDSARSNVARSPPIA